VLVRNIALAAEQGGASHIDIACDPELVRIAKASTRVPVCVSAVRRNQLAYNLLV
jgi:hypothetical protein